MLKNSCCVSARLKIITPMSQQHNTCLQVFIFHC
jgi:hypothetical protein